MLRYTSGAQQWVTALKTTLWEIGKTHAQCTTTPFAVLAFPLGMKQFPVDNFHWVLGTLFLHAAPFWTVSFFPVAGYSLCCKTVNSLCGLLPSRCINVSLPSPAFTIQLVLNIAPRGKNSPSSSPSLPTSHPYVRTTEWDWLLSDVLLDFIIMLDCFCVSRYQRCVCVCVCMSHI